MFSFRRLSHQLNWNWLIISGSETDFYDPHDSRRCLASTVLIQQGQKNRFLDVGSIQEAISTNGSFYGLHHHAHIHGPIGKSPLPEDLKLLF